MSELDDTKSAWWEALLVVVGALIFMGLGAAIGVGLKAVSSKPPLIERGEWLELIDGDRTFRCYWLDEGHEGGLWCYDPEVAA